MNVVTDQERPLFGIAGEQARQGSPVIARLMADRLANPAILSLAAGFTDNALLPQDLIVEAIHKLAASSDTSHLQYGTNMGRPGLRQQALELLRSYPGEEVLALKPEDVLITNGSQQGLYMLVQALCDPGDIVLVEQPSYFVFLELLRALGVQPLSIPCDTSGGLDVEALERLLNQLDADGRGQRLRLVYLMGTFANPSTRCIPESDKRDLAALLRTRRRQIPVVEDMAYRELYFNQPYPARSCLALKEWEGYPVLYAGTFTKPFATGLKVGFLATSDRELLQTVASIKGHQDFGTANYCQAIVESVLEAGAYPAHLSRIRNSYRQKCELLTGSLREHGLPELGWHWQDPEGGLLLWAHAPEGTDTRLGSPFHQACLEQEILYVPGDLCFAEGQPFNCVRLSFGALEVERIPEAARRFCAAAHTMAG